MPNTTVITAGLIPDLIQHLDENGESFAAIGLAAAVALHNAKGLRISVSEVTEDPDAVDAIADLIEGSYLLQHDDELVIHPDEVEALTQTYPVA